MRVEEFLKTLSRVMCQHFQRLGLSSFDPGISFVSLCKLGVACILRIFPRYLFSNNLLTAKSLDKASKETDVTGTEPQTL